MAQAGVAYHNFSNPSPRHIRKMRNCRMNRMMLRVTMILTIAFLFVYIGQLTTISAGSKEIQEIRGEIAELKEEQEQLQISLASRQNIDRVRDIATGKLGMNYPVEEQVRVISFSGSISSTNTQTAHDNATP